MARLAGLRLRERWSGWDRAPVRAGQPPARLGLRARLSRPFAALRRAAAN
jgi:hypothetical protein